MWSSCMHVQKEKDQGCPKAPGTKGSSPETWALEFCVSQTEAQDTLTKGRVVASAMGIGCLLWQSLTCNPNICFGDYPIQAPGKCFSNLPSLVLSKQLAWSAT